MPKRKRTGSATARTPRRNPHKGKPTVSKINQRLRVIEKSIDWYTRDVPHAYLSDGSPAPASQRSLDFTDASQIQPLYDGPNIPLSDPSAFTDGVVRRGKEVMIKKISFKAKVHNNLQATSNLVRLFLVRYPELPDSSLAGASVDAPVLGDILQHPPKPFMSPYKKGASQPYSVMWTQDVRLGAFKGVEQTQSVGVLTYPHPDFVLINKEWKMNRESKWNKLSTGAYNASNQKCTRNRYAFYAVPMYAHPAATDGALFNANIDFRVKIHYTDL